VELKFLLFSITVLRGGRMGIGTSVGDGLPRVLDTWIHPLYTVLAAIWLQFHPLLPVQKSDRLSTNPRKILVQFGRDW